jgi:rSAM/selenodomain-associated transferase 1
MLEENPDSLSKNAYVVIMARSPNSEGVKTRIAQEAGIDAAKSVYRDLLANTIAVISGLPRNVRRIVAWTESSIDYPLSQNWTEWLQPEGTLGERMAWAIRKSFVEGAEKVALIGTDCPTLNSDIFIQAFDALEHVPVVLGPAEDGGYYLVGTTRNISELFPPLCWGASDVLQKTLLSLDTAGVSYRLLEKKYDVDRLRDWLRWKQEQKQ